MAQTLNSYPSDHPTTLSGKEASDAYSIPIVDFDVLVNGTADQRSQAIHDLARACEDWGFFMVINHGVPEALKEAVMESLNEVLSLPEEEKAEYLEAAPMDPISIGTGYFSAVDEVQHLRHYLKMDVAAEFATRTRDLMQQLAKATSESLGLDGGRIPKALNLDSSIQMLAHNHYPAYTGTGGGVATALPPHTDPGIFALIFQNGIDGLQVQHNGQWILARPVPGAFFVLAGDQLEIVSNQRYRAVIHRAVVGGEQDRTSVVSMLAPCLDAVVEPVQELVDGSHGRMGFRGMRFRDYIVAHQRGNRANGQTAMDVALAQDGATARTEQCL